ncbi:hypothetical protein EYF80_039430 [Liparis tanakae]|uniref:Uncharacterized protein n=1 Tax=Liparis tanakae TaxID=230148 RepID=A0A4Z2GA15_9TELE|nr:hypothetical protein EYF80_039430 [Liparis tanakae]
MQQVILGVTWRKGFFGSNHTEHGEQQTADLYNVHYHDGNIGHQLGRKTASALKCISNTAWLQKRSKVRVSYNI